MIKPDDEWGVQIAPLVNALKPAAVEKTQAGYQDWPFAILFVVNIGVISILMATWGVKAVENNDDLDDLLSGNDMKAVVGIASGLAVIAMFLALMMTKVIASYARGVIMFVLVFNLVAAVAVAVIGIAIADMFLTTIGVVIAALSYCYVRSVKPRIPLAVAHLRVAAAATAKSESIYAVSLVFAIVQCVWVVVWGLALLGVAYKIAEKSSGTTSDESAGKTSRGTSWPYFFLLLSFYWGVQVFKNIVHTTVAGTVATFWYHTESASAVGASLKRAMTTSFGSICFGSLVVAILQTLHASAKQSRKRGGVGACLAECVLSWLETIMEYLNRWAYVYVGVYGYSFMKAGSAVSHLFRQRGFSAFFNGDLVRIVIRFTAIGVGLICACFGAMIAELTDAVKFQGSTAVLTIIGFVVGTGVAFTPLAVISSSVATIFVCFAEDPVSFQRSHPELYAPLVEGWHNLHPELMVQAGYWHA
ncbi:hypothetical protein KRP22_010004 [Phytophthora ramorum]|nr:Protein PNS1 [Phytophthora ramorum]